MNGQFAEHYSKMNTIELERATRQFDEEFVVDKSRPLTPEQRRLWSQIKRKRSRSTTRSKGTRGSDPRE